MANKVLLKRSSVTGKAPTTSDLDYGELSINYTDGLLYYKTFTNTISVLNAGSSYGNTTVASYLPTYNGTIGGNITIGGKLTTSGNVSAQYFLGDGTYLTGLAPSVQQYLFSSAASDISPYYQAAYITDFSTSSSTGTATVTVRTSGTLLASFLTTAGHPGTTITAGQITGQFETQKASGNRTYTVYFELWKRTSGGTETKLLTSDTSTPSADNTLVQLSVTLLNTATISLAASDRVLIKIYAYTTSGTDSITINWGNNTNTGFTLPTAAASASQFIPYNNATSDINLGQYSLTSTASVSASNINLQSSGTTISTRGAVQATVATTSTTAVDTWSTSNYRLAKYIVQIKQGTNFSVHEILIIQDGTTAYKTEYGVIETNNTLATFTADISSGNARLLVTMTSAASATINISRELIVV
jgi:hypothetical protein